MDAIFLIQGKGRAWIAAVGLLLAVPLCGQPLSLNVTTVAGNGTNGLVNSNALSAEFSFPSGVALDAASNLYVVDNGNNCVREMSGGHVTTIASNFGGPIGICVDSATNVYVADQFGSPPAVDVLSKGAGSNWTVTKITNVNFQGPAAVAIDASSNLYVADVSLSSTVEIFKVSPGPSRTVTNFAGPFSCPSGQAAFAFDSSTNLFLVKSDSQVVEISPSGVPNNFATNFDSFLNNPAGIAIDATGVIYVANSGDNTILAFNHAGTACNVVAGTSFVTGSSNGVGPSAQFNNPTGLTLDPAGNVYIADTDNNLIRMGMPSNPPTFLVTVGVNPTNAGTITPGGAFVDETNFIPTATPAAGYAFLNWTVNGTVTNLSNSFPFNFTTNATVIANFVPLDLLSVRFDPFGGGTVSYAGASNFPTSVPQGSKVTLSVATNPGYIFLNWSASDGIVLSEATNYSFIISNNTTITANFIPPISVTAGVSSNNGGTVIGGGSFAQGASPALSAIPKSGYSFVAWTGDVSSTNNPLMFSRLSNDVTVTANFISNAPRPVIVVIVNGPGGIVTPAIVEDNLVPGRKYTLTAKLTNEYLYAFSNWSGSINTNKASISFTLNTNMLLEATFVPNIFYSAAGVYNGLFYDSNNGVLESTAGMLRGMILTAAGTYSGTLLVNGGSHHVTGKFALDGLTTNTIRRSLAQGGDLMLKMGLFSPDGIEHQITGTVTGSNGVSQLLADEQSGSETNSAEYTMLIPPGSDAISTNPFPPGDGYALITNHFGNVTITGALSDGASFNQNVPVSGDGYVPVYVRPYGGKGLVMGWINLYSFVTNGVGLTWIHPELTSGLQAYRGGFTNVIQSNQLAIAPWTYPPENLQLLTNLQYFLTTNALSNVLIKVNPDSGACSSSQENVSGGVVRKTGAFKISVGIGGHKITVIGALINPTNGAGYFSNATNAGAVKLGP